MTKRLFLFSGFTKSYYSYLLAFCSLIFSSATVLQAQNVNVTYKESTEDFANPERGFYIPRDAYASKFVPLDAAALKAFRTKSQTHGSAKYAIYSTLFYRGYILDSFNNKPLSATFLNDLQKDFYAAREAGFKLIIRFAYTNKAKTGNCADENKICPPYGDAPKQIVLQHIAQLKPLLRKNADVIAVMQEGFIGIWGENFYTDYFGDPGGNGPGKVLDTAWRDRNEVLKALLNALPKDRMVQVRTPQIKQKFVYGANAPATSKALTQKEAFNYSDKARISFHNDCFLSGPDDYGTFFDYGSSSQPKQPANEVMRRYFEQDSKYGPVGGETCDDIYSPQNDCGPAEREMAAMHYSFLNTAYNNNVNNDWDSTGCITSIKQNLGYRFVLHHASFASKAKRGQKMSILIQLENKGYASPYNPRLLQLVLRNTKSGKEYFVNCKADVRFWFTGKIDWKESVQVPANIPTGSYHLLLNLPDKHPSISKNPAYSIRLANEDMWEESTGYNNLHHTLSVIN